MVSAGTIPARMDDLRCMPLWQWEIGTAVLEHYRWQQQPAGDFVLGWVLFRWMGAEFSSEGGRHTLAGVLLGDIPLPHHPWSLQLLFVLAASSSTPSEGAVRNKHGYLVPLI